MVGFPYLPFINGQTNIGTNDNYNEMEIEISDFLDDQNGYQRLIGPGFAAENLSGPGWVGSLGNIDQSTGYWLKLSDNAELQYEGYLVDESVIYNIPQDESVGYVSFGCPNTMEIEQALGDLSCDVINKITTSLNAAECINGTWVGSLLTEGLDPKKGYNIFKNSEFDNDNDGIVDELNFAWECNYDIDLVRTNNEDIQKIEEIEFIQSNQQSFYFIESINDGNESIELNGNQWIVSYCNGKIAGSRFWNGSITDVPVMGYNGYDETHGLCEFGDTPEFKLYDSSTGDYLDLYLSEIPEWVSNETYIVGNASISGSILPGEFELSSVHPNPFNPITNIEFVVPENMNVSISIFDISGREINRLQDGIMESGYHSISWDANYVSSGIYFLKIIAGNEIYSRKLMLVK